MSEPAGQPLPDAAPGRTSEPPAWLAHVLGPLGVSVAFHVLVLFALTWVTWDVLARPAARGDVDVSVRLEVEPPPGLRWPTADPVPGDEEPLLPGNVDPFAYSPASELADLARQDPTAQLGRTGGGGFGIGEAAPAELLGIGGGTPAASGGLGEGAGLGSGVSEAGVWNLRAKGEKFAYVVDFSGSVIVAVDELRRELKRSVSRLSARQLFNVYIFYGEDRARGEEFRTESFAAGLQPATTEAKRAFFDWIDAKSPRGSTEPLQAVQRALAAGPDAIFFFSDGYFTDEVVTGMLSANRAVGSQFHCLVFDELLLQDTSDLPRLTEGARRLQRLAEQTRGQAKVVTGADLKP